MPIKLWKCSLVLEEREASEAKQNGGTLFLWRIRHFTAEMVRKMCSTSKLFLSELGTSRGQNARATLKVSCASEVSPSSWFHILVIALEANCGRSAKWGSTSLPAWPPATSPCLEFKRLRTLLASRVGVFLRSPVLSWSPSLKQRLTTGLRRALRVQIISMWKVANGSFRKALAFRLRRPWSNLYWAASSLPWPSPSFSFAACSRRSLHYV